MNLHLNKTVRIRLAITLFLLALVTGLSTIANPTLGGTSRAGTAGTAAPYGPAGAASSALSVATFSPMRSSMRGVLFLTSDWT